MNITKPDWLKIRIRNSKEKSEVEEVLGRLSLHTVCSEALCPNLMECFSSKTAAFMILGQVCTRDCTFCGVAKGEPSPVDKGEPARIAAAVSELELSHAVITSVTRDDLPDGGAGQFAGVIKCIRDTGRNTVIEVLVPDFKGSIDSLKCVADAGPMIINHNVETVPRLYPEVRPSADYGRSVELIRNIKRLDKRIYSKSGIMAGLGESFSEVAGVMEDLRGAGCEMLTIGQYLAPSKDHHRVVEYIRPDIFEKYRIEALRMGFKSVSSGPFVRSSYNAGDAFGSIRAAT